MRAERARPLRAEACVALLLAWFVSTGPLGADEHPKFQIFGYLTQAFGWSQHGSIRGVSEDGTTDLRNLAIQFRWRKSDKDEVVLQLSHERRGDDFLFPEEDEIEVDWAFYERRLGPVTELKVGRLNVPLGIYNEIRDVGTLLPFFDLPLSFYAGVLSTAETVDGVSLGHIFAARSNWDVETTFYYGGWDTAEQQVDLESRFLIRNLPARAENGVGVQLWLETPVSGLRFGAGALSWKLEGTLSGPGIRDDWRSVHLSVDAVRESWVIRAELRQWRFEQDIGRFLGMGSVRADTERDGFYLQVGHWLNPKTGVFAQLDDISLRDDSGLNFIGEDLYREYGLSINHRFRPDILARIEIHKADTLLPLGIPGPPPGVRGSSEVYWGIIGLSVDF